MTARLVLATANEHKVAELRRILDGLDLELVPMGELGLEQVPETGATFEDNALLKARAVTATTGLPALADDSGLEVDALDGAPGVHSSRYAGPDGDDAANNDKLLAALDGAPDERRTARFVAVAALVTPDGEEVTVRGTMEGRIARERRGTAGFGYDPLFVSEQELGRRDPPRTNGELDPAEKDARSHRGAAFRAIRPHVERLVAPASAR